jgi:hypothetical protein
VEQNRQLLKARGAIASEIFLRDERYKAIRMHHNPQGALILNWEHRTTEFEQIVLAPTQAITSAREMLSVL